MELIDQFNVRASASETWDFFWDLPRLAKCLPGAEDIQKVDDTHYTARLSQKVGPFSVSLDMNLEVTEIEERERVVVVGQGKDKRGNTLKLNRLEMKLNPLSDNETEVSYKIDFNLMGRLATLGNAVIKRKSAETRDQFTENITKELQTA